MVTNTRNWDHTVIAKYNANTNTHEPQMFINPHKYESYGKNTCPSCGMEYEYDEGDMMVLTKDDLAAIRKVRGIK
jgi:hypothetical protein